MPVEAFPPVADLELRPELRDFDEHLAKAPPPEREPRRLKRRRLAPLSAPARILVDGRARAPTPRAHARPREAARGRHRACGGMKMPRPRFIVIVLVLLTLNYVSVALLGPGKEPSVDVAYNPTFREQVKDGNVERISAKGETDRGQVQEGGQPAGGRRRRPRTSRPRSRPSPTPTSSPSCSRRTSVIVQAKPINSGGLAGQPAARLRPGDPAGRACSCSSPAAPAAAAGMGALGAFSRSRARRVESGEQRITFNDVAGIDEAKAELTEIVDFLKNPDRYRKLGGRIPRGVLLSGQPGTGKTLLAKAVAGEAGVPFFSISASEFVEAIVGIGASRVRDLFKTAKESSPAIIFIDELDAIGRSRSSGVGFGGGNDEREQTLNQILTEMDGFESDVAVIVLGATNRPEILDGALLRPGRFDRRVVVPPPDKDGRRKILEVHTRSLPLDDDVDLDQHRLDDARHGRRRPRQPRQRGGPDRGAAQPREGRARRLHRRAREDRARRAARHRALRGGPQARRLPRGRPRDRRHAHAGRRPGPQGLDHPARDGARRHAVGARARQGQLRGALPADEDPGRARRPRGRGARLRHDHDGRRVRHRAADRDRPRDGRALGDEQRDRPDRGAALRGARPDAAGRGRDVARHAAADRPGGPADRRREPPRPSPTLLTEHREKLESLVAALLEHETLDQDAAYAAARVDPTARRQAEGQPTIAAATS